MDTVLQIPNTGSFLLKDAENGTMSIQLNPRSFTILRQAIIDGTSLPGNSPDFENRFNRGALQIFLERDPSVYDVSRIVTISCCAFSQFNITLHSSLLKCLLRYTKIVMSSNRSLFSTCHKLASTHLTMVSWVTTY